MRKSLVVGVIAAIAASPAMADAARARARGAAVPTHRSVAPPAQHGHHGHAVPRSSVVIRYVPAVPLTTGYAGAWPRFGASVQASPYFIVTGSAATRKVMTFAEPEPLQNWNWTRVESIAALAPRKVPDENRSE